jgi:hypothetical protein
MDFITRQFALRGTMKHQMILCVAIAFPLSAAILLAGAGQLGDSKLKRELDTKLPAESRYAFPAVNKEWMKTTRYLDPVFHIEPDPEKVTEQQKKTFDKREVLSKSGKMEGDYRALTYDPSGKLRSITDQRGDDHFTLSVHADGAISRYSHARKGKPREAYTVSPDGSEVCRVSRGSGIIKDYFNKPNDFAWNAFHEGDLYFRGEYADKKLNMVWLVTNKEKLLRWRNGAEDFYIDNGRTWWGRLMNGKIGLVTLDGEFVSKVDPERVKLWEGKYTESISAFYDRYDALLNKTGSNWAKFEIEFVRKGKPFPD